MNDHYPIEIFKATSVEDLIAISEEGTSLDWPVLTSEDKGPSLIYFYADKVEILRYLIESGLDINKCNCFGTPALEFAISTCQSTNLIKNLIEHGAKINDRILQLSAGIYKCELKNSHSHSDNCLKTYHCIQELVENL